tara:strand:- start:10001 stop:11011 length:1011 start_codon:yes stop_codon:yes gene_type:complete
MKRIKVLDCTLRDGGYVNKWEFGNNTFDIIKSLYDSDIEIIECGFLNPKGVNNTTQYRNFNKVNSYIRQITKEQTKNTMFVAMIELDEYDPNILPSINKDENQITGIRMTFRKSAKDRFIKAAKEIISKGYKLFVQPISTISYNDREILNLIDIVHELKPYSLYMVDTHGSIDWHSYDLKRMFTLMDNNLDKTIPIGFHSHNNLQLSYALACELINISTHRNLIIDSSLLGMGRGAGNLHTEMVCNYLNNKEKTKYNEGLILSTITKFIQPIKNTNYWGYSIPYFLSASIKCHPNYASYLQKNNISTEKMVAILNKIPTQYKLEYNQDIIKELIDG